MGFRPTVEGSVRWVGRAAIVLTVLVLAEILLRLFMPWNSGDIELRVEQELPGVTPSIVYTENRFGFRSTSMTSREKPAGTLRVLCLGASSTRQPTQATEDIWCSRLQAPLESQLGVTVETAALGRGGWTARDLLSWASENLSSFEPDLVVTLLGINDLCWNGGPGYSYEGLDRPPLDWAVMSRRACLSWSQLCPRAHAIYTRVSDEFRVRRDGTRLDWHSRNLPGLRQTYAGYPAREAPLREPDPLVEFTDSVAALTEIMLRMGTKGVLLGQPVLWHAEMDEEQTARLWFPINTDQGFVRAPPAWLDREMDRYDQVQQARAAAAGLAFVDLDAVIPKTLDHYFDDCHLTDRGNLRVAESILPAVTAQMTLVVAEHRTGDVDGP